MYFEEIFTSQHVRSVNRNFKYASKEHLETVISELHRKLKLAA